MSEPVIPCPTCPEGWRPLDKEHCASCYEGQIERLREAIEMAENRLECALYGEEPVCKHCVELAQSYLQEALVGTGKQP